MSRRRPKSQPMKSVMFTCLLPERVFSQWIRILTRRNSRAPGAKAALLIRASRSVRSQSRFQTAQKFVLREKPA